MPSYRKKPVVIQAVQLTWGTWGEMCEHIADELRSGVVVAHHVHDGSDRMSMVIKTLEGEMTADHCDWIIRGIKGELYPCKPDIFEATYQADGLTPADLPTEIPGSGEHVPDFLDGCGDNCHRPGPGSYHEERCPNRPREMFRATKAPNIITAIGVDYAAPGGDQTVSQLVMTTPNPDTVLAMLPIEWDRMQGVDCPRCETSEPHRHGDPERPHIVDGKFQSDKYPLCPPGKVPLSVTDPTAQDLLWTYGQRRRAVDAEFTADLEFALLHAGYPGPVTEIPVADRIAHRTELRDNIASLLSDLEGVEALALAATADTSPGRFRDHEDQDLQVAQFAEMLKFATGRVWGVIAPFEGKPLEEEAYFAAVTGNGTNSEANAKFYSVARAHVLELVRELRIILEPQFTRVCVELREMAVPTTEAAL